MGFYEREVLPRITNLMLGSREFRPLRSRVAGGLSGEVVEVGFGSGLNVPYYPRAVSRVMAVDPSGVGRKLASKRVGSSPVPVEYVGMDGEHLPIPDESVDHVLTTMTLCTIPDVEQALGEIRRVLRPGGSLHFLEHGLSPDPKVARRQDRLNGLQRRTAGGCNLNRPIARLIEGAGLHLAQLDNYSIRGPKTHAYMYEGVATKTKAATPIPG